MPPLALALVLGSALVHATWNVLLSRVPRGIDTSTVAAAFGLVAWTPLALARWRVDRGVWPYLLVSAVFQLGYFVALNRAYARAPAHATYPVARGLAPVLLLSVSGRVPPWAGVAVGVISGGILLTTLRAVDRRALAYAVPVAVCIAGYTFVDARGLHHADPATYLWLSMMPVVLVLLVARTVAGRGAGALRREVRPVALAVGLGLFGAYGLTLTALALVSAAQVPAVAAARESSILFVLALTRPSRLAALGGVLVFGGVVLLAVT
jgi:drug/metabolite transporter (DMT)-like permease